MMGVHDKMDRPNPDEPKISKVRSSLKKKPSMLQVDEFAERLKKHTHEIFDEIYPKKLGQMYYLEDCWSHLIGDDYMTAKMKKQQQCIWEFLTTERNYLRRMRVVCEVFQQVFRIAKREGDLADIHERGIFANIDEVLITNDNIWREYLVKVIDKTRKKRRPIKPSELLDAFHKTDELYQSYVSFCMQQDACLKRIRQYSDSSRDNPKRNFRTYLDFCEGLTQCERLKLVDLMTEPMQRMTRYPLLLKSIHDSTENPNEKKQVQSMIKKFEGFIGDINTKLRTIHEKDKMVACLDEFEEMNTWSAGNEDVMWGSVDFLRSDVSNLSVKEPRCILKQGNMKMVEKKGKSETNIEMLLFTDVIVFTRRRTNTKKLLVIKQLHFLDRVKFIKSEISNTSIVVLYLDEYGLLANAMMLEMPEKIREQWMEAVSKAQDRYEKAKSGSGSTLEFFQDDKGASDENHNKSPPQRKTSDLINSVEISRKPSVGSRKGMDTLNRNKNPLPSTKPIVEDNEPVTEPYETGETGLNRRSASWLLTDEKDVHSIRKLLREDLWGSYVKVKPSYSFRSETSDLGISMDANFEDQSTDVSPGSSFRISNSESLDDVKEVPVRKLSNASTVSQETVDKYIQSSSSNGLPGISEHLYTEINFIPGNKITHPNQRRSIKQSEEDENNNQQQQQTPTRTKTEEVFYDDVLPYNKNGDKPEAHTEYDLPENYLENR